MTAAPTAADETRALLAWIHGLRLQREKSYARAYWRWLNGIDAHQPAGLDFGISLRRANRLQMEIDRRMPGMRAQHAAEATC